MNERVERRKNGGLTNQQVEILSEKIAEKLETKLFDKLALRVGNTVLSKGLYLLGAAGASALAWLHGAGKIFGASE